MRVDPTAAMMAEEVAPAPQESTGAGDEAFAHTLDRMLGLSDPEPQNGESIREPAPERDATDADDARGEKEIERDIDARDLLLDAPATGPQDVAYIVAGVLGDERSGRSGGAVSGSETRAPASDAERPDVQVRPQTFAAVADTAARAPDGGQGESTFATPGAPPARADSPAPANAEHGVAPRPGPAPSLGEARSPIDPSVLRGEDARPEPTLLNASTRPADTAALALAARGEAARAAGSASAQPRDLAPRRDGRFDREAPPVARPEREARPSSADELARTVASAPRQDPSARSSSGVAAPISAPGPEASFEATLAMPASGVAPAPAGAAATTTGASSLVSHPVHELPQQVQILASNGGGTARMRLSPPELGDLRIQVSIRGSTVDVVIHADESAAQVAVMSQREQLADALGARDLRMEAFDVSGGSRTDTDRESGGGRWRDPSGFEGQAREDGRPAQRFGGGGDRASGRGDLAQGIPSPAAHASRSGVDLRI